MDYVDQPIQAAESGVVTIVNVTTTATALPTTPAPGRQSVILLSMAAGGGTTVFVGFSNAVTISTGFPLLAAGGIGEYWNAAVTLWGIVASGTVNVAVVESVVAV